ncbi:hypothetical protein HYDPIDRAFT_116054 [Hydnomerulius pinastri MD-312]|uniref:Enoyl reductase (ER) domain-containing protein n=1 Tax=Hydnomerulius pinastri MD-312 TaxID=994086 RepID=A0A0C9W4E5_9AGAM|nr:hypothetical protein HYDPIDRAFT_116054 [Hydnomerulius pinastri MD-312]
MSAIVLDHFGGLDALTYATLPVPVPAPGEVLIRIRAFGLNHAEIHMRKGEWAEAAPVSGIECVGIVVAAPVLEGESEEKFPPGTCVATLMGGLGRTRNGSYAQYTVARASNVVTLASHESELGLDWATLAAIPESYATAWTCLFRNLEVKHGDRVLIRGATSSLGQAAVKLAVGAGARVVSTTRNPARFQGLLDLGVERVEVEGPSLAQRLPEKKQFDAVLNLVGNAVLLDSLDIPRRGGRVCQAGWLGGLAPVKEFDPLSQMASGVQFSLFASFVFGEEQWPLEDVPLKEIVKNVVGGEV